MNNQIVKHIQLKAPVTKVWRALTDYQEFGKWFRVNIDGPFVPGKISLGKFTFTLREGEDIFWNVVVQKMEHEKLFSYLWHPYAVDPKKNYDEEIPTLVEFHLAPSDEGTLLTVTESGFDKVPQSRRDEAFRMNTGGWEKQLGNLAAYVS